MASKKKSEEKNIKNGGKETLDEEMQKNIRKPQAMSKCQNCNKSIFRCYVLCWKCHSKQNKPCEKEMYPKRKNAMSE